VGICKEIVKHVKQGNLINQWVVGHPPPTPCKAKEDRAMKFKNSGILKFFKAGNRLKSRA
jgi:hypothetical protein